MSLSLDSNAECDSWLNHKNDIEKNITKILRIMEAEKSLQGEFSLTYCDDECIKNLNKEHRQKDKPTNVLSFSFIEDMSEDEMHQLGSENILGDIFVAYETIMRESQKYKCDFVEYTTHMILHGMLHIIGYDHESDDDTEVMEIEERRILNAIGINRLFYD